MQYRRQILETIAKYKKSILLLGPRQTGKSTLISSMGMDLTINLADESVFVDFLRDPGLLKKRIASNKKIFIDEVQRIPSLLNSVQALLDQNKELQFFLTGSSATKLKRGKANLLPGRIITFELGPLSLTEIDGKQDLDTLLSIGAMPGILAEPDRTLAKKVLRSYSATYLREEIQAEALTRNLEGFSRFFDIVASRSGEFIDFSKYASQAAIERTSARRYFDILVDTLVVQNLPSFTKSSRRRLIQHPRFYFFDVGVLNGILGNLEVSADRRGNLFEHLCLQMLLSEAKGRDETIRISTYRTEAGAEVDFLVEKGSQLFAIEAKSSRSIDSHHLRGLQSFREFYGKKVKCIVLYPGEHALDTDGIQILPLRDGIREIFE